jgi:hypothetical protein
VNHRDLPRLATKIGDVCKLIEGLCDRKARGKHTCVSLTKDLQLLREWEARGYPQGGEGTTSGVSDPTGNAALTHDIVLTVIDPVSGMPQNLEWWLSRLFDSAHAVLVIHELVNFTEKNQGRQNSVPLCCEPACEDPAASGRSGRCEACYRYRHRWSQEHNGEPAPPVPRDIIQARVEARQPRRRAS